MSVGSVNVADDVGMSLERVVVDVKLCDPIACGDARHDRLHERRIERAAEFFR